MKIENSVFLVTGGGSGLGAATARMIVANGGRVVLIDVNDEAGRTLAGELGTTACFVRSDVADEASAQSAVATAVSRFGGLQGLVNCAGVVTAEKIVGKSGPHRLETFARVISVNLIGTFNMIRLAADVMSKAAPNSEGERGVIINTASVAAFDGQIGQAAYASSKAGVAGMTLPLARELARFGIRVVSIAPGTFETPMMLGMPPELLDPLCKSVPFPARMGRPAEFAALVRHIAENAYLNGEVIRLDGAIRMPPK